MRKVGTETILKVQNETIKNDAETEAAIQSWSDFANRLKSKNRELTAEMEVLKNKSTSDFETRLQDLTCEHKEELFVLKTENHDLKASLTAALNIKHHTPEPKQSQRIGDVQSQL